MVDSYGSCESEAAGKRAAGGPKFNMHPTPKTNISGAPLCGAAFLSPTDFHFSRDLITMSGVSVLQHFEAYQKARVSFVQVSTKVGCDNGFGNLRVWFVGMFMAMVDFNCGRWH